MRLTDLAPPGPPSLEQRIAKLELRQDALAQSLHRTTQILTRTRGLVGRLWEWATQVGKIFYTFPSPRTTGDEPRAGDWDPDVLREFRKQHQEILVVMKQLEDILNAREVKQRASEVRRLLALLWARLDVHLTRADPVIARDLVDHWDENVRNAASVHMGETAGLRDAWADFVSRWPTDLPIAAEPESFTDDARRAFRLLEFRIEREDHQLFPLVERLEGARRP